MTLIEDAAAGTQMRYKRSESSHLLNRYLLPTLTICIGTALTLMAFLLTVQIEIHRLQENFISKATHQTHVFKYWVDGHMRDMRALQMLFDASDFVDASEFAIAAEHLIASEGFMRVLYIKPDPHSKTGWQTVYTQDYSPTSLMPVPQMLQHEKLHAVLAAARQWHQPRITPRLTLSRDKTEREVALIYPAGNKDDTQGMIIGVLDMVQYLEQTFAWDARVNRTPEFYLQVFAQEDRGSRISAHGGWFRTDHNAATGALGFSHVSTIDWLSQQWKMVFTPTGLFVLEALNVAVPWLVLGAGMIITAIVGLFLFTLINRNVQIEREVRQRTLDWKKATIELRKRGEDLAKSKALAEAASSAKGEFLANMSHEIRTPLNSMIGMTELLMDTELSTQQQAHIRVVLNSAETLLEIINDILDFSKIESGKLSLEPVAFNLQHALEDIMELFRPKAQEKEGQLELLLDYQAEVPKQVIADPVRIKQIVCNLLSNAIKFTKAGYVSVCVECDAAHRLHTQEMRFRLSVRDTGIGIDARKLSLIFDKFSQADASTTRQYGGTGLGLAISQQLVQMMGGEIGVNSELGKGSEFWFTMKLALNHNPQEEQPFISHDMLQGLQILLVEDVPPHAAIMQRQLSQAGMRVTAASSAEQVLQQLQDGTMPAIDMAIIDYHLPQLSGESLIKRLRQHSAWRHLPWMMISALGEKGYTQRFASLGCAAFLTKPIRQSSLLDILALMWLHAQEGKAHAMFTPYNIYPKATRVSVEEEGFFAGAEILLVEDNRVNQHYACEVLGKLQCKVSVANHGIEALAWVKRKSFDLILMDCQMPQMDGFEASQKISALKRQGVMADTPVIALTANAMKGDRERCLASGMNDYISKPMRRKELKAALIEWLPPKEQRVMAVGDPLLQN